MKDTYRIEIMCWPETGEKISLMFDLRPHDIPNNPFGMVRISAEDVEHMAWAIGNNSISMHTASQAVHFQRNREMAIRRFTDTLAKAIADRMAVGEGFDKFQEMIVDFAKQRRENSTK